MSIIFGMRTPDDVVDESQLMRLADLTRRYAPDGTFVKATTGVGMGFQPYHTHQRSSLGAQPATDGFGNMLVFDGRLDNHAELCQKLDTLDSGDADPSIVLAAFDHWNEACFTQFTGEWALALWSQADRTLFLARDHAGTRTLYFENCNGRVRWSTFLETLIGDGQATALDEEYIARYLAGEPFDDRTPYKDVRCVPAAHFIAFRKSHVASKIHSKPLTEVRARYRSDAEYEEHFFALFRQSVERRTGPGAPILAQLSGGMDSSSIVCMSDYIRKEKSAGSADLVETISYYDESEPNWDERPYFTAVEASRGRVGIHVDVASHPRKWTLSGRLDRPYLLPGMDESATHREAALQEKIGAAGYRVILSGLGGDELLGGVPTPLPELADLFMSRDWSGLWRQSLAWSLVDRAPIAAVLVETIRLILDCYVSHPVRTTPAPWLKRIPLLSSSRDIHGSIRNRLSCMPSAICVNSAWRSILGSLPNSLPDHVIRYEYRFPYLDRDLANFLLSVPRGQLVRPGQRRSLMRRALRSIVPPVVLQRRRKAYLIRNAALALQTISDRTDITELRSLCVVQSGFVDPDLLRKALIQVGKGNELQWIAPLWRTLLLDLWLRSLQTSFARPTPCIRNPQGALIDRAPLWKFNRKQKEAPKCVT